MKKHHKLYEFAKIMQFTRFCRDFDLVAKYAFSQAPSCTNLLPPGSLSDSRTGPQCVQPCISFQIPQLETCLPNSQTTPTIYPPLLQKRRRREHVLSKLHLPFFPLHTNTCSFYFHPVLHLPLSVGYPSLPASK